MKKFTFKKINKNYYRINSLSGYSLFCSRSGQDKIWTVKTIYGDTLTHPGNSSRIRDVARILEKYCV